MALSTPIYRVQFPNYPVKTSLCSTPLKTAHKVCPGKHFFFIKGFICPQNIQSSQEKDASELCLTWITSMFKMNSWVEAKLEVGGFMLGLGSSRGGLG